MRAARSPLPGARRLLPLGLATLVLVAAAGGGAAVLTACGDGGGLGLAIATVGVSAIFAGASPGAYALDPALTLATVGTTTVALVAEDDISLDAAGAATATRYLVLGGDPFGNPPALALQFEWESDGVADLAIEVAARDGDDFTFAVVATTTLAAADDGPTALTIPLTGIAGSDLRAGDVLRIRFQAVGGQVGVLVGSRPALARVTVDVTDPRARYDIIKAAQTQALVQRPLESEKVSFGIGRSALGFTYLFTGVREDVFFSSNYGAASSTPPISYTYRFLRPHEVDCQIVVRSTSTTDPAILVASAQISVPGAPAAIQSAEILLDVPPGPDPVVFSFAFDFGGTLSDFEVTATTGQTTVGPFPLFGVNLSVDSTSLADVEILPESHILVPAPTVTATFPGGRAVTLSQPPRP